MRGDWYRNNERWWKLKSQAKIQGMTYEEFVCYLQVFTALAGRDRALDMLEEEIEGRKGKTNSQYNC